MDNDKQGLNLPDFDDSNEQLDVENVQDDGVDYEVDDDQDVDTDASDVDVDVDDEDEPDKQTAQKKLTKKAYTPDEIKRILRDQDFSAIDTSRLSEEGKAVMKAMQAGLTPKLQESAELRRELQEIKNALKESAPKAQPKDIFEAFDQDPDGTMKYVNSRIQDLIDEGADTRTLEKVREIREQLRDRRVRQLTEQASSQSKVQETVNELLRRVPDIDTKQYELREFAIEYMGMSPQEVDYETSIQHNGMNAVKTIARINTAYDKLMATKRAKAKAKARKVKVEKPGGGFQKQTVSRQELIAQAKKTGNWRALLLQMED